jgi:uncharacterized protein YqkB
MKQEVEVNVKLTLWLDADMDQESIGVYVRESLYAGFEDQLEYIQQNKLVDILDIKEEAEIYGN